MVTNLKTHAIIGFAFKSLEQNLKTDEKIIGFDGDEILELYQYLIEIEHYERPFLIHWDQKPAYTIPIIRE